MEQAWDADALIAEVEAHLRDAGRREHRRGKVRRFACLFAFPAGLMLMLVGLGIHVAVAACGFLVMFAATFLLADDARRAARRVSRFLASQNAHSRY